VESFDQRLLTFDPAKGEVTVAGRRGETSAGFHGEDRKADTGVSGSVRTVDRMTDHPNITEFFDRYQEALLRRDEHAIAELYAVPGLILFPGQAIPVSDAAQTRAFFASNWEQYEGVDSVERQVTVMAEGPVGVWADVRWSYGADRGERFCYQLVEGPTGYQIAVLTLMG